MGQRASGNVVTQEEVQLATHLQPQVPASLEDAKTYWRTHPRVAIMKALILKKHQEDT